MATAIQRCASIIKRYMLGTSIIVLGGIACAVLAGVLLTSDARQPAWVQTIRLGLTAEQVDKNVREMAADGLSSCWLTDELQSWSRDEWIIHVHYRNNRVMEKRIIAPKRAESVCDRVLHWLEDTL
jgi:hypothetical protein